MNAANVLISLNSYSFYFWYMIPGVQDDMEGCPDSDVMNLVYMTLSRLLVVVMFFVFLVAKKALATFHKKKTLSKKNKLKDAEFRDLQLELYGETQAGESLSATSRSSHSDRYMTRSSTRRYHSEELFA